MSEKDRVVPYPGKGGQSAAPADRSEGDGQSKPAKTKPKWKKAAKAAKAGGTGQAPLKAVAQSGPQPGAQAKPAAQNGPQPGAQAKPAAQNGPQPGAQAKPAAQSGPQPGAQAKPAAQNGPQPGAQATPAVQNGPQPGAQAKPAAQAGPQPGAQAKPAAPNGPQPGAQAKPAAQAGPQPGAQQKPAGQNGPQQGGPQQGGPQQGGMGAGAKVVEVRPLADRASFHRRHWGLLLSFFLVVIVPLTAAATYLYGVSLDRYGSITGFTVRSEESGGASELLGGIVQFTGSSSSSNSAILYEFIQSQEMVEAIDAQFDLRAIFSAHWGDDPLFSLWPDASIEELLWYWQQAVRISFDQSSGLIEVRVIALDADTAQSLAQGIVAESQKKINEMNQNARADAMRYAEADLAEAIERLKTARGALTAFRTRTQIVDPSADIQGQMGVVNSLQQQLASALVELDLLRSTSSTQDPRVTQVQRQIDAIRSRIADERASFANDKFGSGEADYPTLMAEYEGLTVDREYAEESYRAALTALDAARAQASRQSLYLATYIQPTLPQDSKFPQRGMILGLLAAFLVLVWGILTLIYYSLRDRR
ncbi:sugar transporter [Pseudooceanicola nanhaiensis]|uniref:sugar transporter n=1 Tax=Pseudooceanicola nanhaiensis TaxID=375761 RepID=UPI001CD48AF1|nr:sugar transporter [Pseudooceanicola nanhaiensis]MCA0922785.1 sugar transporter [Pseudooceanicola nanhaiensis]